MRSDEITMSDVDDMLYAEGGPLSPLATPRVTRVVLEAYGLATKKALGQNFLVNDSVLQRIVSLAELDETDRVLEVGPGIGTLTIALLKSAGTVVSVERDTDLPAVLAETCAPWRKHFALINKDALELSEDDIKSASQAFVGGEDAQLPNKFVANLPYAVAATLVLDFFERFTFLDSATVMVQKEVADRMTAVPGTKNYGAYTVKLRLHAQPDGRFLVGPNNFFPPPRVDSSVLRLNRAPALGGDGNPVPSDIIQAACTMADASFTNRRKTIANSCKTYFAGQGAKGARVVAQLPALFEAAGVDAKRRGETLSLEEFIDLGKAYSSIR